MNFISPVDINFKNESVHISWNNGMSSEFFYWTLRTQCPCAHCIDEFTNEKLLDPNTVPLDIKPVSAERVGAYGMQIRWSDGHGTGIYTWDFLLNLEKELLEHESKNQTSSGNDRPVTMED